MQPQASRQEVLPDKAGGYWRSMKRDNDAWQASSHYRTCCGAGSRATVFSRPENNRLFDPAAGLPFSSARMRQAWLNFRLPSVPRFGDCVIAATKFAAGRERLIDSGKQLACDEEFWRRVIAAKGGSPG